MYNNSSSRYISSLSFSHDDYFSLRSMLCLSENPQKLLLRAITNLLTVICQVAYVQLLAKLFKHSYPLYLTNEIPFLDF